MAEELARYQEGYAEVVVSRDGDVLVFREAFDDNGRIIDSESQHLVADFVARGAGPWHWPWFDLGERRAGALLVLDALGVAPPPWTEPLAPPVLELFLRAARGSDGLADLLVDGFDVDPVDACGASPLWYATRSLGVLAPVPLLDAGADASRRVDLGPSGERWTTILHELVRMGRTVALAHALDRGVDPSVLDSEGSTPIFGVDEHSDHVNPEIVRRLAAAGASVSAASTSGTRPIEVAVRRVLPATVAAMVDLSADPTLGLDVLSRWWSSAATHWGYRAPDVVAMVEILRAGGAEPTDEHRTRVAEAGVDAVVAALA